MGKDDIFVEMGNITKDRERPLVGRGEVVRKRPVFDMLGTTLIRQMDMGLDLKSMVF